MNKHITLSVFSALTFAFVATATADDDLIATLRKAPLAEEPEAEPIPAIENEDIKRARNYPMQPPTIPHTIRNYQVDLYANKCLSCHGRRNTEESQAPMISVTHYMNRDAQFLAEISPRRYFCTQCHVPQHIVKPMIDNDYQDVGDLIDDQAQSNGN